MVGFIAYKIFIIFLSVMIAPFAAIIAAGVALSSGLPVLFRQKRVGKNGKIFTMYKFRTMIVGAEKQQEKLKEKNEANGPVFKIRNDPRFTSIGKWLSRTGLDELPQLANVISGDMALIGPRPLPVPEAKKLTEWQKKRHAILPGIISPWVLDGYHKRTFDEWMKSDIQYIKEKSFLKDVQLFLLSTVYLLRLVATSFT